MQTRGVHGRAPGALFPQGAAGLLRSRSNNSATAFASEQTLTLAATSADVSYLCTDPRRAWKGPWRWFHEALLDCCAPLARVEQDGVTLTQACLT